MNRTLWKRKFRAGLKCYLNTFSVILWCVWPTSWVSFQDTAGVLELLVPVTNTFIRQSIFSMHTPEFPLINHHRLCFRVPQQGLCGIGIATSYGLENRGVRVRVPVGASIFSSPCRPVRFWGPSSLLTNGYWRLFPRGQSGRRVKLTTHLQLVLSWSSA
jgi:hypothetical protein